jgi:hypothetical protein
MNDQKPIIALAILLAFIVYQKKNTKSNTSITPKGETIVTPTTVPLLNTSN